MKAPSTFYLYIAFDSIIFISQLLINEKPYPKTIRNTMLLISAYGSTLFSSIILYRVFFYRLRSFPEPYSARVSKFWYVYQARHALNHRLIFHLHEKYGSFVRTNEWSSKVDI